MNITNIILHSGPLADRAKLGALGQALFRKGLSCRRCQLACREGEVHQLRRDSTTYATLGLKEVVNHYEQIIRKA